MFKRDRDEMIIRIKRALTKLLGSWHESADLHGKDMVSQSLVRSVESTLASAYDARVMIPGLRVQHAIDTALTHEIDAFLSRNSLMGRPSTLDNLAAFRQCFADNPAREGDGATSYNTLLWLYLITHSLNPRLIVESGVHIGRSLWTLRRGNPDAAIYAFDISLSRLRFRDKSIEYVEDDWSGSNIRATRPNDFCYFDDHVNNCLRIRQAYDRGFRHLIFDDSPALVSLFHFRYPGIPTAQMISENYLAEGDTVRWQWRNEVLEYSYREQDTYGAQELIEHVEPLPSLERFTGMTGPQHTTYVRLRPNTQFQYV